MGAIDNPDGIKRLNLRVEEMARIALDRGMSEQTTVDLICGQLEHADIVLLARNSIEHRVAVSSENRATT